MSAEISVFIKGVPPTVPEREVTAFVRSILGDSTPISSHPYRYSFDSVHAATFYNIGLTSIEAAMKLANVGAHTFGGASCPIELFLNSESLAQFTPKTILLSDFQGTKEEIQAKFAAPTLKEIFTKGSEALLIYQTRAAQQEELGKHKDDKVTGCTEQDFRRLVLDDDDSELPPEKQNICLKGPALTFVLKDAITQFIRTMDPTAQVYLRHTRSFFERTVFVKCSSEGAARTIKAKLNDQSLPSELTGCNYIQDPAQPPDTVAPKPATALDQAKNAHIKVEDITVRQTRSAPSPVTVGFLPNAPPAPKKPSVMLSSSSTSQDDETTIRGFLKTTLNIVPTKCSFRSFGRYWTCLLFFQTVDDAVKLHAHLYRPGSLRPDWAILPPRAEESEPEAPPPADVPPFPPFPFPFPFGGMPPPNEMFDPSFNPFFPQPAPQAQTTIGRGGNRNSRGRGTNRGPHRNPYSRPGGRAPQQPHNQPNLPNPPLISTTPNYPGSYAASGYPYPPNQGYPAPPPAQQIPQPQQYQQLPPQYQQQQPGYPQTPYAPVQPAQPVSQPPAPAQIPPQPPQGAPFDTTQLIGKTPDEVREICGTHIYTRTLQKYGESAAPQIAGMLLEFPIEQLKPILENPTLLDQNIDEAYKTLQGGK